MKRLFLPLALLALAACAGSPTPLAPEASGPYAGIPEVKSDGMTAEAQPVAPTGDNELDAFLADVAAAIDRHDWYTVAKVMEAGSFAEQRALIETKRSDGAAAQIIGETLGLGSLVDYTGGRPWKGFDTIEVITLRSAMMNTPGIAGGEASVTVEGDVRVASGDTLPIQFTIVTRDGKPVLQVPLG